MNLKKIVVLFLLTGTLTGTFCACRRYQEINSDTGMTLTPIVEAGTPMLTKEPVPTLTPELEEMIPIDAEHFTDEAFREFLSTWYDTNRDGFLSLAEREAVKEMEWEGNPGKLTDGILDGFEYFPCLEELIVINADKVIFENHPSIRSVGGGEGGIGLLYMENCPALEYIGGDLYSGNVTIKNCRNLKLFSMERSLFGTLSFSGTPQLVLSLVQGSEADCIRLDADAVLSSYTEFNLDLGIVDFLCFGEDGIIRLRQGADLERENVVEWENVAVQALRMPEGENYFLKYFDKDDFAYMGIQVLEKIEDCYDEQGRKGWNICIDLKRDAYSKKAFSFYTEEMPEPEQIFVRPAGVEKVKILEYSPNHGGSFLVAWELEVVYAGVAGENILGTMTEEQYWTIAPDGTKTGYLSEREWRRNGSREYQAEKQLGW